MAETSFPKSSIKVLLLENIHPVAKRSVRRGGLSRRDREGRAAPRPSSPRSVRDVHVLGIRSKTQITPKVLDEGAPSARGRCVLHRHEPDRSRAREHARRARVQRAVLEHALGRRADPRRDRDAVAAARRSAARGPLGPVAQGRDRQPRGPRPHARHRRLRPHRQPDRRARRAFGMRVVFYDIMAKLPMGNNRAMAKLEELLAESRLRHAARSGDAADQEHDRSRRARADEARRVPVEREPRHRRRRSTRSPPRCRAAMSAAPRSTSIRAEPEGNSDGFETRAARPAERDPDAAHRRLDRRGPGGDRQGGLGGAAQVRQPRRDDRRCELSAGRARVWRRARIASSTSTATFPACSATSTRSSRIATPTFARRCCRPMRTIGYLIMDLDQRRLAGRQECGRRALDEHQDADLVLVQSGEHRMRRAQASAPRRARASGPARPQGRRVRRARTPTDARRAVALRRAAPARHARRSLGRSRRHRSAVRDRQGRRGTSSSRSRPTSTGATSGSPRSRACSRRTAPRTSADSPRSSPTSRRAARSGSPAAAG